MGIPMRRYCMRVEVLMFVELPLPKSDELLTCCDPEGNITDAEAVETAVSTAMGDCKVFVYGEHEHPADVNFDTPDITIEGFEDE